MTPIELMIVKLMADGFSSREIAERTTLTKSMVDQYRVGMLKKLGLKNSCHLIKYYQSFRYILVVNYLS